MAPPDSGKVALGVLAVAGVGLVLYLFLRKRKRSSRTNQSESSAGSGRSVLQGGVRPPAEGEWKDTVSQSAHRGKEEEKIIPKIVSSAETTPQLREESVRESASQSETVSSGLSYIEEVSSGLSNIEEVSSGLSNIEEVSSCGTSCISEVGRKEGELDPDDSISADSDTASAVTQMTPFSSDADIRASSSTSDVRLDSRGLSPLSNPSSTALAQGDVKSQAPQRVEEMPARETSPGLLEQMKGTYEYDNGWKDEKGTEDSAIDTTLTDTQLEALEKSPSEVEPAVVSDIASTSEETVIARDAKAKDSMSEDVSIKSGDVSNGDALSFEQINYSSDDVQSEGSEVPNGTGTHPFDFTASQMFKEAMPLMETLQSLEQALEHAGSSNTDSLRSFEQISESSNSASFIQVDPSLEQGNVASNGQLGASMEVVEPVEKVPEYGEEKSELHSVPVPTDSSLEVGQPVDKVPQDGAETDLDAPRPTEELSSSATVDSSIQMAESLEKVEVDTSLPTESLPLSASDGSSLEVIKSQEKMEQDDRELPADGVPFDAGEGMQSPGETDPKEASDTEAAATALSGGDSVESFQSFEMLKGGGSQDYYSSESLASYQTAHEESTTSGSQLDFYSPISSPETVGHSHQEQDHSFGKPESDSDANFESFDMDTTDELMLDEAGTATESPQDRTPTNTPVAPDMAAGDDEFATPQAAEGGSAPDRSQEAGGEGVATSSETFVTSQQGDDAQGDTEVTSGARGIQPSPPFTLSLDKDKMTAAILQAQSAPDRLEIGHLQVLTQMLAQDDHSLVDTALQCIIRATAFTLNVNILRVCECPKELNRLLDKFAADVKSGSPFVVEGSPSAESLLLGVLRAINNLAMDIKTQPQLEGSLPALTDLLLSEGLTESVTIATLQPLTNMSSTPAYHGHYTRILHQLYSLLDTSHNAALRLQCLKVLVNLSLNADMVPHMLAAKAPECLLELIDINCDIDLLLRTVTFLANVMAIMQEKDLSPSSLPPDEKAASPETMHAALFALDRRDVLRNKVYRLTRHQSEDVCYQASRLYKFITTAK